MVLLSIYALDLFLGNADRHADNFVIERDAEPRIRVIDFSEATALMDPGSRTTTFTLFDHLVGGGDQGIRHGKSKDFSRLQVDFENELYRGLDRQLGRPSRRAGAVYHSAFMCLPPV
jgi:hypothetical protein